MIAVKEKWAQEAEIFSEDGTNYDGRVIRCILYWIGIRGMTKV